MYLVLMRFLLKMQMVKIRQHRNGLRVLKKKRKWT